METATSLYNALSEVLDNVRLRRDLLICDVTLREGEHAAQVGFSLEEKLEVARRLAALGVRQIQGGVARSAMDMRSIKAMKAAGLPVQVETLVQATARDWQAQIGAAADSGADVVALMHPTSSLRLKRMGGVPPGEIIERAVATVGYAVDRVPVVRFSAIDATRTDLDFLLSVCTAAVEAGARRVGISDTVGCISPAGMRYLVSRVVAAVPVPVQVHCHNDFGAGLANAVAAAEAGAHILDASVNGLGERAGNVCLDELVVTLQVLYGQDLGIDLTRLTALSEFLSGLTGVALAATKPLTGPNAFAHKGDSHVREVEQDPQLHESIPPAAVGNRRRISLGKGTGPYVVGSRLGALGLSANPDQVAAIIRRIEQQAVGQKRALTEAEFAEIAQEVLLGGD